MVQTLVRLTRHGLLVSLAALAACSQTPVMVDDPSLPPLPVPTTDVQRQGVSEATDNLLALAARHEEAEEWAKATLALERALRIHPRDPGVWHRLAKARLQQGQWREAENLALRANSFAVNDPAMQARNWWLVVEARLQQQDLQGAQMAENRARSFEEQMR